MGSLLNSVYDKKLALAKDITNGIVNAGSGIINHYIQQAVAILEDQCSNGAYIKCQNGGRCIHKSGDYKCLCSQGFTGQNCEVPRSSMQDSFQGPSDLLVDDPDYWS